MDPVQMNARCSGALPIGRALLPRHRVAFVRDEGGFEGGVATIVASEGDDVWGVLWQLSAEHWASLDEWEGYPFAYSLEEHTVLARRRPVHALAYVATTSRSVPPARTYLDGILRGARHFGLPEEYVSRLERFAP